MKLTREMLMQRIARKQRNRQSTAADQRQLVLLTARQIRREIREERRR